MKRDSKSKCSMDSGTLIKFCYHETKRLKLRIVEVPFLFELGVFYLDLSRSRVRINERGICTK